MLSADDTWLCGYVSIPVWCDLERHDFGGCNLHNLVSIPVWCDLEDYVSNNYTKPNARFNSSMVRFGDADEIVFQSAL